MTAPRLLLSATQALLEGWFGPVVVDGAEWMSLGGCHGDEDGFFRVHDGLVGLTYMEPERVFLDLSRAECRDRVVRVLGGTDWVYVASAVGWWLWLDRQPSDRGEGRYYPASGPALAGLDPNDDTRLPDGSRLVDALALAAVARHILGGAP